MPTQHPARGVVGHVDKRPFGAQYCLSYGVVVGSGKLARVLGNHTACRSHSSVLGGLRAWDLWVADRIVTRYFSLDNVVTLDVLS